MSYPWSLSLFFKNFFGHATGMQIPQAGDRTQARTVNKPQQWQHRIPNWLSHARILPWYLLLKFSQSKRVWKSSYSPLIYRWGCGKDEFGFLPNPTQAWCKGVRVGMQSGALLWEAQYTRDGGRGRSWLSSFTVLQFSMGNPPGFQIW